MTVNPATLMWSGDEIESTLADNFRSLDIVPVKQYAVTCTPDEPELNILNAPGLPGPGQVFSGTISVYAFKAKATRISPVLWHVLISYKGYIPQSSDSTNPLAIPAIIDWDDVEVEEEIDEDFDGNPIQTACGEPVTGIKAIFCDQVATIKKNMATYNSYTASVYRRSVNSDIFLGWPAGTAKLMKLSGKEVKGSFNYYEVTGVVQFRIPYRTTPDKAWYARWRHEGLYQKADMYGSTRVVRSQDGLGEDTAKPVLLDANGFRLAPGATPVWKQTKRYQPLPYAALGLLS